MGLFTKDTELKDKLEISNKDLLEAEANFTGLQEEVKSLTESVSAYKDSSELIQAQLDKSTEKVVELEASLKEEKAKTEKAEANQVDFDAKVANASQAKLAEMGTPEPVASEDNTDQSSANLYKEYRELQAKNPEQASKFWESNKANILNR